jgi:hypothetical protein
VSVGPVAIVDAGSDTIPEAEWVTFRWGDGAPPTRQLTRAAAAAGTAALVALRHGQRKRIVNLDREPGDLHLDAATLLFRAATLREHGLRPDPDLDPDLSALLLAARYLLVAGPPTVAVGGRNARPGTETDRRSASRYSLAPQRFADLLASAQARSGSTPRWLQNLWLGKLFALLRDDARLTGPSASLDAAAVAAFHSALAAARQHIDDAAISGYTDAPDEARAAVLLGAMPPSASAPRAHTRPVQRRDPGRRLSRTSYYFTGDAPTEIVTAGGAPLRPEHHKLRSVEVVGRPLLTQRILWVPMGAKVDVDGRDESVLPGGRTEGRLARYRRVISENEHVGRTLARDLRIRLRSRSAGARARYRSAWLLMDRDTAAQDNAEHLYRHLRSNAPDVNAWFVLARESPDWERLERSGFRLLEYGSDEFFVALLNCDDLISSQVDDYVIKPLRKHALGSGRWRFTFLQHGVLWHDLSHWLNKKRIDCFVTSTPVEQAAIVGDGTNYVFTDLEVRMTGLPRHDRLWQLAQRAEPRHLLVMPTWRLWLLGEPTLGNERSLRAGFWDSDYARAWRALLESDELRALCEQQGWQLDFVPHPNMAAMADQTRLPGHVVARRFDQVDVQRLIADAAALVTDYSSLANDAAYAGRPVVYYQFDRAEFFGGADFRRLGDWNYERDGFGPVTGTADATVAALERIAAAGGAEPPYADRIRDAFPLRDGRCCERVVEAIRALAPAPESA